MKHTGERGAFPSGDFENNKPYNLSFCFNLKNGVIINICHLRRSQLEGKTKDFYRARCRISVTWPSVTWPSGINIRHVLIPNTSEVQSESTFLGCSTMCSKQDRWWAEAGQTDNTNVGCVIQGAPLLPSSKLASPWGRSLQGGRTYPPGHHSPGTHVPIIPCLKWSKASLGGLCGSSPSQGQAPRTEGWPWAASYWAMDVNKTWVSRLACLHTFL